MEPREEQQCLMRARAAYTVWLKISPVKMVYSSNPLTGAPKAEIFGLKKYESMLVCRQCEDHLNPPKPVDGTD